MPHLRTMTLSDIPLGLRLSGQAGWNQLEGDWRRMLTLSAGGSFVAEAEGEEMGTVVTCRFGNVAWIAMMLVEERHRRRGVGRALMKRAIEFLDGCGIETIRLDATPLGRPLYELLGFVAEYPLCRYAGTPAVNGTPAVSGTPAAVAMLRPGREAEVKALDHKGTATDRGALVDYLLAERPESVRVVEAVERLAGYLTSRPGRNATQVGPCVAEPGAGEALLADAWRQFQGQPVFVDVPDANEPAVRAVTQAGLTVQRPLLRMRRGPRVQDDPTLLWASAGPEKG